MRAQTLEDTDISIRRDIYIIYIHTEYAETEMYMHKYMTQTRKHGHMHRDIRRSTWYMETDGRQTDT